MRDAHRYDLLLFTSHFPYGAGETFLADELEHLSKGFESILLCPLTGSGAARSVPANCDVLTPQFRDRADVLVRGLANTVFPTALARDFMERRVWADPIKFRRFGPAALFLRRILSNLELMDVLRNRISPSTVLYFYWSVGFAYAAPFLPCRNPMVARFHGSDLYEEDWGGYTPFRRAQIARLDALVFVSRHGMEYLKSRYAGLPEEKLHLFRLGTRDHGVGPVRAAGPLGIASCSNLIPLKKVDLLLKALGKVADLDIEYTCIGDGPERPRLEALARRLSPNVKASFKGSLPHSHVMEHFERNPVDLFVNTSRAEGLPVAIMEALSFGIPVLATDVGGVSELVDGDIGGLLDSTVSPEELRSVMEELLTLPASEKMIMRERARARWKATSDAGVNHARFREFLVGLSRRG
jgi:glycosyltransferase involved in cell wall biosynthesis